MKNNLFETDAEAMQFYNTVILGNLGILLCFGYKLVRLIGVGSQLVYRIGNRVRRLGVLFGFLIG